MSIYTYSGKKVCKYVRVCVYSFLVFTFSSHCPLFDTNLVTKQTICTDTLSGLCLALSHTLTSYLTNIITARLYYGFVVCFLLWLHLVAFVCFFVFFIFLLLVLFVFQL